MKSFSFGKRLFLGTACALVAAGFFSEARAEYHPRGKRDPFVPLMAPNGQRVYPPGTDDGGLSNFVLQGIVYEPQGESYAIINDRIVREQDEIEGMKVLKIGPTFVTILSNGNEVQLTIRSSASSEEGTGQ